MQHVQHHRPINVQTLLQNAMALHYYANARPVILKKMTELVQNVSILKTIRIELRINNHCEWKYIL